MYCKKCGKEIVDEAIVCPYCGVPTDNYKPAEPAQPAPAPAAEPATASFNNTANESLDQKPKANKNVAPLVFGVIGSVVGMVNGFVWMLINLIGTAAREIGDIPFEGGIGFALAFLALGFIGSVLALIGGILAFKNKLAGTILLGIGFLMQIGVLICNFVQIGDPSVALLAGLGSVFAVILLAMGLVFAIIGFVKKKNEEKQEQAEAHE